MFNPTFVLCFTVLLVLFEPSFEKPRHRAIFRETSACECGGSEVLTPRIVGGKEAKPHAYPWMVALLSRGSMHCGGSLINDRYVLTAGHCLKWSKQEDLLVLLGVHDRSQRGMAKYGNYTVEIESTRIHENFVSELFHDRQDIALIKLKHPVRFTPEIKPVCLPKKGDDFSGRTATVTGWGRVGAIEKPSEALKETFVDVISNQECKKNKQIGALILDSMLCAYKDKADACQGDSGGPLILENKNGGAEQIGVVSWGIGCAETGIPGVYTRTSYYVDWIARHTADAIYCRHPE